MFGTLASSGASGLQDVQAILTSIADANPISAEGFVLKCLMAHNPQYTSASAMAFTCGVTPQGHRAMAIAVRRIQGEEHELLSSDAVNAFMIHVVMTAFPLLDNDTALTVRDAIFKKIDQPVEFADQVIDLNMRKVRMRCDGR